MDDLLYKKVHAAASAGWWTLLVAVIFATIVWAAFLAMGHCKCPCVSAMWGGVSWDTIQTVAIWAMAAFKIVIWTIFLVVVWLTIWARKLKRL